jgi:hypothetical protein
MRGRRHDSIALPGGRRDKDPDRSGTRFAAAQSGGAQSAVDPKQTGKPDDARINVDQEHEVKHWSERFGVSRDELRRAVQKVGPMVERVKQHLKRWTKPGDRTR